LGVALRHLLVQDSAPGSHPLHVPGAQGAAVSQTVAVIDAARQHIGDGLDAPVRMPGKSRAIVVGAVVAEVVEQQKGIELARVAEAEGAAQLHAGALDRRLGLNDSFDGSN
jgi:hypothetical protein